MLCFAQWLNNCIGRRNYVTFILLMFFVLLMVGANNFFKNFFIVLFNFSY